MAREKDSNAVYGSKEPWRFLAQARPDYILVSMHSDHSVVECWHSEVTTGKWFVS